MVSLVGKTAMAVNRNTDYAMRALMCITTISARKKGGVVTVDEVAKRERLPRIYLRRLLQQLARKKILRSHKGKGGGFSFRRRPASISVDEIVAIFQGPFDLTNCVVGGIPCPRRRYCKLRKKLKVINEEVRERLGKITVDQII